jgi:BON domain/YMGG-like Gly-zipper
MRKPRTIVLALCTVLLMFGCKASAPDDAAIRTSIQSRLYQDSTLRARGIQADSQKGVVTLTGTVNSDAEKSLAEQLSVQAPGVKEVVNQLNVSQPRAAQASAQSRAPSPRVRTSPAPTSPPAASTAPQSGQVVTSSPARSSTVTVPSGSVITVRMIDGIDSKTNTPDQTFAASVAAPVVVGNQVVIAQNSDAIVRLVSASSSGKFKGSAQLQLQLVSVTARGTRYDVQSGNYQQSGASRGKRTAETVGGGAALGALVGAIAGKGKGAAIGAGVGAAAGAGYQVLTKGSTVKVPSETKIDFTLAAPLNVTMSD